MKRRAFLASSLAATALWPLPRIAAASGQPVMLRAGPVTAQILPAPDGTTAMWGFNGRTPGPELRIGQGQRLEVRFENGLTEGSAIHWHGIRLPNAMDGVPGMTQPLVEAGAGFDYAFAPPDAGTFWYHSHHRSWEQVARGLYGPLIVEETTPPDVDHDITVVLDDWRLTETGEQMGGFDNMHDQAHAGRLGNFARALFDPDLQLKQGARVRLRVLNAATDRVFPLDIEGIDGKVVALDGMPLPVPEPLARLTLAPAQRVDIIADVTAADQGALAFLFPTRDAPYELGLVPVLGVADAPARGAIEPLPPHRVPLPRLEDALHLPLVMEGGAMGGMRVEGGVWSLNGVAHLPAEPLARIPRGRTARISLINDTRFAHGIHLHGHHFHELSDDDRLGALRDTSLVAPAARRDIACVFDNPGKWLLHCHMLGHQAGGMKTWIEVI